MVEEAPVEQKTPLAGPARGRDALIFQIPVRGPPALVDVRSALPTRVFSEDPYHAVLVDQRCKLPRDIRVVD